MVSMFLKSINFIEDKNCPDIRWFHQLLDLNCLLFSLMKFVAFCWSCSRSEKFWKIVFQVATLEVVLAAEEIRWTFSEEKFVRWIAAGQGSDLIFDLAWVALLLGWRVSILAAELKYCSFLLLMQFVAYCWSCSWAEEFVRWVGAGQVSDLIFGLAWVALLLRWWVLILAANLKSLRSWCW